MSSSTSLTEFDQIISLLVAGRDHRDAWLPVRGTRNSGFHTLGGSIELTQLGALSVDPAKRDEARNELQMLLTDPTVQVIMESSPFYPARLKGLDGRPALLFVKGKLSQPTRPPLAIVGSRKASSAGVSAAHHVSSVAAAAGHLIVSGLAAGIDAAGHQGALDAGGQTLAVMGTGIGRVYPSGNQMLAKRIEAQGALVTQFPFMHPATQTTFPARNALIAGLSDVSLLIEMGEHSGTRIEAECALAQGKRVLLWAPLLESHDWAREFANQSQVAFVETVEDVLSELLNAP